MNRFRNGLFLSGSSSICFITANADGSVTDTGGNRSITGQGDVILDGGNKTVTGKEAIDPNETPEAKATREAAEAATLKEAPKEETAEEKTAREAKEAEGAAKPKAELAPEEVAEIEGRTDLNDAQKESMKKYTLEMKSTGGVLSDESVLDIAKTWNVPISMVKDYVASIQANYKPAATKEAPAAEAQPEKLTAEQQAAFDSRMVKLTEVAGSKDNWTAFVKWASEGGLTDAERLDLANSIDASPEAGARAAKEYISRFNEKGGSKGGPARDLSRGASIDKPVPETVKGFANREEQNEAIRKTGPNGGRPLFETDAAYRQEVESRMMVSNFSSGVNSQPRPGAFM